MKKLIYSLVFIGLISCQNGPESEILQEQVQSKLEKNFKAGLFKIKSFKRRGSYSYDDNGAKLLVYYKAQLELLTDYKFNNWNKIGQSSLISVLGSTASGITGINPEGNQLGDKIQVYGGQNYLLNSAKEWKQGPYLVENKRTTTKKKNFISDIEAESHLETENLPGLKRHLKKLQLISKDISKHPEELIQLKRDLKNILIKAQIVADLGKAIIGVAAGTEGGEYYQFSKSIENVLSKKKQNYKGYETFGSFHNMSLVSQNKLSFGIAQGDILRRRNNHQLVALMALFPEVVQVIALKSSPLNTVKDLVGKNINIGPRDSGTKINALNVLKSHAIILDSVQLHHYGLTQALNLLQDKKIDALFFTGAYPTEAILNFSKKWPIKLLNHDQQALSSLQQAPAKLNLVIPKNIYFGQDTAYPTIGTTAILFSHKSASNELVENLLTELFTNQKELTKTSSKAGSFSKSHWSKGIEISIHPQAQKFFK